MRHFRVGVSNHQQIRLCAFLQNLHHHIRMRHFRVGVSNHQQIRLCVLLMQTASSPTTAHAARHDDTKYAPRTIVSPERRAQKAARTSDRTALMVMLLRLHAALLKDAVGSSGLGECRYADLPLNMLQQCSNGHGVRSFYREIKRRTTSATSYILI